MYALHATLSILVHRRLLIPLAAWTSSVKNSVVSGKLFSSIKKARCTRAFLLSLCLLAGNTAKANDNTCLPNTFDEQVEIAAIIDGDTILLKDERFVRLIGINAPELNKDKPPAEPLAKEAKEVLGEIIGKSTTLKLAFDGQRRDRYQRLLAHAFTEDRNIQQALLERGLASHIFFPPNKRFQKCYADAEKQARENNTGIWQVPRYQTHPADILTLRHIGFYRVSGRVKEVKSRRGNIWLVITDRFSFRIDEKNMKYFKKLKPEVLRTHSIEVSGWIFPYKSGLNMRINHPDNIKLLD